MNLQQQVHELMQRQLRDWPLLRENHGRLASARLKTFSFDGYTIFAQWNPDRIISSSAKVEEVSVRERPCFLCLENRPAEEGHVAFGNDYEIMCNPYPIFRDHFTISRNRHTPQVIDPEFGSFLDLSRELPDLVVFYNAPSCGASAPDHMHFQAGNRDFMPIGPGSASLVERYGRPAAGAGIGGFHLVDDGLRRFCLLESSDRDFIEAVFRVFSKFMRKEAGGEEPMLNMLSYYDGGWKVFLFPRKAHRPWQYFETGDRNLLLSPASVDMGGSLILPLEKDFHKITMEDIRDVFGQLVISDAAFGRLGRVFYKAFAR
jgi:hypothetical protein